MLWRVPVGSPSPFLRPSDGRSPRRPRHRALWGLAAVIALALASMAAVWAWSGATLAADATALARVDVQRFGGRVERARAFGPAGRVIPVSVRGGRLTPRARLAPGERVSVEVVVRRPGWLAWALGNESRERLALRTPVAHVRERWLTVPGRSSVRVQFDQPVSVVAYGSRGPLAATMLNPARRAIVLPRRAEAGSVEGAAAARPWGRLGTPVAGSWVPPPPSPLVVTKPAPRGPLPAPAPLPLTVFQPGPSPPGTTQT